MYDVTREELVAAVEAEEQEWLSTDDIHPYKSRVPHTKGNTVSFPKITKFNTYLLNHYGAEIVEEINGLLYDGELAAICGVDGFYSQQLTHDRCRIDPRMTFWRVNKYEFTADLVVYLKANAYNDDYSGLQAFTLYVSLDFCIDDQMTYEFGCVSLKQPERDRIKLDDYLIPILGMREVNAAAEDLLFEYMPETLHDYKLLDPFKLAKKMGLEVAYHKLYKNHKTKSVLYWFDSEVKVTPKDGDDKTPPIVVKIPAGTILINENAVHRDRARLNVYHECFHDEYHWLFYRLQEMDNMIKNYAPGKSTTGAAVAQGISSHCLSEHDFTLYSDLTSTAEEVEFTNVNPVEALLGDEGFIAKYGGELARDWFDVFLVDRVGSDTNVQIREGKNLTGISYDVDLTDVSTRIMPTGQDKDGNVLYLPEGFIDSPLLGNYPAPKWLHLEVSGAKEVTKGDDKKSKTQCYKEMRQAVADAIAGGCDMPTVTLKVDFVNCADTEEYRQYAALQNIFLGDAVRVMAKKIGVSVSMRATQYTYNCLTRKYTELTLGTVSDTLESNTISAKQIPSGSITGAKLAINSVGSSQLQNGAVGSLQIQLAAIQTAHIEAAAITSALIAEAAITAAHIQDATITAAKIEDASITAAKIAEATITAACIAKGTITQAEIADASITAAKIALATITSAQIADAAIGTAKIADLAVTAAKIANATITSAKIAEAAIHSAHIEDAAITRAKIALLAVGSGQIDDLAVGTAKVQDAAISTAKIQDLAVTGAKIANATITNANIANATISTAQIALGAITTALIEAGAVGTAQIADASITDAKVVDLSANSITTGTLSVERLIIVGSDQSIVYTINEANGTAQLSQTTIDGGSLTQRSITADRIVAGAITANEIAAATILANNIAAGAITTEKLAAEAVDASKIKAGSITTSLLAANFGEELDLSSNRGINLRVDNISQAASDALSRASAAETAASGASTAAGQAAASAAQAMEAIQNLSVGGVNLIDESASYRLVADGADTYWMAADELEPETAYTLSVKEVLLEVGQAAGVTWKVVNRASGAAQTTGTLDFTYGRQVEQFITPSASANYALYLYAGISGSTTGVTVVFNKIKLEEGTVATSWSASPEDTKASISEISSSVDALDSDMDNRIMALIDSLGLSEQYASASDFLAAVQDIELIRSELSTHDADMTLTFNRLTQTEAGLAQLFSSFVFGDDGGIPYLDMSTSDSSVKMRLTNTRLAFVQGGSELAYFSDNKLYVTRHEAVEQISIGTSTNGFLDIVTTPTGVGFKWRS